MQNSEVDSKKNSRAAPTPGDAAAPSTDRLATDSKDASPSPPEWLLEAVAAARLAHPDDKFDLRHRRGVLGDRVWRIACLDCPGKLYVPGPQETLANFEVHLKNRAHRSSAEERVRRARRRRLLVHLLILSIFLSAVCFVVFVYFFIHL